MDRFNVYSGRGIRPGNISNEDKEPADPQPVPNLGRSNERQEGQSATFRGRLRPGARNAAPGHVWIGSSRSIESGLGPEDPPKNSNTPAVSEFPKPDPINRNWQRLMNHSPPPDLNRGEKWPPDQGQPVGPRMYTFGSNPDQLLETETPRNIFYDPRKRRAARDPKENISNAGTLCELLRSVVKYTRIESCDEEAVKKVEKDVFHIEKKQTLGGGLYGEVFVASRTGSDIDFALKIYHARADLKSENIRENKEHRRSLILSLHEIIVMKILRGKAYFVQILDHFIINDNIYILMEMENGTLESQLRFYPTGMEEDKARKWFFQMAQGLAYMHKIGIAHSDIKTDNIVIRELWNKTTICKFTDFGRSKFLPHAERNIKGWISAERDKFKAAIRTQFPKEKHGPLGPKTQLRQLWQQDFNEIKLEMAENNAPAQDIIQMGTILNSMLGFVGIPHFPKILYLAMERRSANVLLTRLVKDLLWTLMQRNPANQITADQMINHLWLLHPGKEPGFRQQIE